MTPMRQSPFPFPWNIILYWLMIACLVVILVGLMGCDTAPCVPLDNPQGELPTCTTN